MENSRESKRRGLSGADRIMGEDADLEFLSRASNVVCISNKDAADADRADAALTIFVAMPFDPAFDDVFFVGICSAAEVIGGHAVRIDQIMHGQDAVTETQKQIRLCSAVVADISTGESDVLYELGYAHALDKPSIQICSTSYEDMPFMVRNRETILYRPGATHLLGRRLGLYLRELLAP